MSVDAIVSPIFRLSFPQVFTPKPAKGTDKPKYGLTMLFIDQTPFLPKDANGELICPKNMDAKAFEQFNKDLAKDPTLCIHIRRLLYAACVEAWGADQTKWPNGPLKTANFETYIADIESKKFPIKDGNAAPYDGYAGHLYARTSCDPAHHKPSVVNRRMLPITDFSQVYGGLLARTNINAYAWNNVGGAGVSLGLNHLQIIADDGVRFGGGVSLEHAGFGAYEGPEEDPSAYEGAASGSVEETTEAF